MSDPRGIAEVIERLPVIEAKLNAFHHELVTKVDALLEKTDPTPYRSPKPLGLLERVGLSVKDLIHLGLLIGAILTAALAHLSKEDVKAAVRTVAAEKASEHR